jgi:Uma2 family endonuclease
MGMPNLARHWTREEVLALPDDGIRYELFDGELLVSPSPRLVHQRAVAALFRRVEPYAREHRIGVTLTAPADLDLNSGQVAQPDLFVADLRDGREPLEWADVGIPLLIAEVLSPSTAPNDRMRKRRRFQRSRVPDYWIVDVDARRFEHWRPKDERPAVPDLRVTWHPDPAVPPLEIELGLFFREVWAER